MKLPKDLTQNEIKLDENLTQDDIKSPKDVISDDINIFDIFISSNIKSPKDLKLKEIKLDVFEKVKVEISKEIQNIKETVNNALDSLNNVSVNQIENYLNYSINKINHYLESNLYSLEEIKTFYINWLDYFTNFDVEQQIIFANTLISVGLLYLLIIYIAGTRLEYANYLIKRFILKTKLPKLNKILEYRLVYQSSYFKYLFTLALLILLINISCNLFMLYMKIIYPYQTHTEQLNKLTNSSDKVTEVTQSTITQDQSNIYLENNFDLFSFEDIQSLYSNWMDYFTSFDVEQQIIISNTFVSLGLLYFLFLYVTGLYANYLIERFNLKARYPKINKILEYRLKYQAYYFKYLFILALFILLLNISANLIMLYFTIIYPK